MIFWILTVAVIVISFIFWKEEKKVGVLVGTFFYTAFVAAFIWGMVFLFAWVMDEKHIFRTGEYYTRTCKIYSLMNKDHIEGRFRIGTGYIETKEVYRFFRKKNGGYLRDKVPARRTIIFDNENDKPYLRIKNTYFKTYFHFGTPIFAQFQQLV